jgi:hypothetical protein
MKITLKWLRENGACTESREMWMTEKMKNIDGIRLVKKLMKSKLEDGLSWANWLIVRIMTHEQKIAYACFVARQVLEIFEKKYLDDKRPRLAIEAAEKCIKENSEENQRAAGDAAWAAGDAAWAAWAAGDAAWAAWAAGAAGEAAWAAGDAAWAAGAAGEAAWVEMQKQIIANGIKILENAK